MTKFWWVSGSVVCFFYIALGIIGNGLIMCAIYKFSHLRNHFGYFILSLAVVDLVCSVIVVPMNIPFFLHDGKWKFGFALCVTSNVLLFSIMTTSAILICFIALNRFLTICYSSEVYDKYFSAKTICGMICFAWIFSHMIFIIEAIGNGDFKNVEFDEHNGSCSLNFTVYLWVLLFSMYATMAIIIVYCYLGIYCTVQRKRNSTSQKTDAANLGLLKMLVTAASAYCVSFIIPIILQISLSNENRLHSGVAMFFYLVPAFMGVVINPIIYGVMCPMYREAYGKILGSMFCFKK